MFVWVLSLNSCLGDFLFHFNLCVSLSLSLSRFLPQSHKRHMHAHPSSLSSRIAFGACQMLRYVSMFLFPFSFSLSTGRQTGNEKHYRPLSHSCDVAVLCSENFVLLLQSQSNLKANVEKCLSYLLSGFNCNEIYVMFAMPNKFLCAPLYLRVVILLFFFAVVFDDFPKIRIRRRW